MGEGPTFQGSNIVSCELAVLGTSSRASRDLSGHYADDFTIFSRVRGSQLGISDLLEISPFSSTNLKKK